MPEYLASTPRPSTGALAISGTKPAAIRSYHRHAASTTAPESEQLSKATGTPCRAIGPSPSNAESDGKGDQSGLYHCLAS